MWARYLGEAPDNIVTTAGFLGVMRRPSEPVKAVLSLDLCEVVRETGASCLRFLKHADQFGLPWRESTNRYNRGGNSDEEIDYAVRMLLNSGGVPLAVDAEKTAGILRSAKSLGIYIIANTSVVEGGELATIGKHGLGHELLHGCFDGVLFPRGHDGHGKVTKAEALIVALDAIGLDSQNVHVAHTDDTEHHHAAFEALRDKFASLTLTTPTHEGNIAVAMSAKRYGRPHQAVDAAVYKLSIAGI